MDVATLGSTLDAGMDLFGACKGCKRRVLIDTPALGALAAKYGHDAVLVDAFEHLVCKRCGARLDMSAHYPRTPRG